MSSMTPISRKTGIIFLILMLLCSLAIADSGNTHLNISESATTLPISSNETIHHPTESADNTSLKVVKEPRTELIFTKTNGEEKTIQTGEQFGLDNSSIQNSSSAPLTNASERYLSLGDIIKAQDWNALSEYKCKIKTENPESFDDSEISMSDKQARWNSRFTAPPVIVIPSCCG